MSYAKYRQDHAIALATGRTDGQILFTYPVPPNVLVDVFKLRAWMTTAGAAANVTLSIKVDGGTAVATVVLGNSTGHKANTITTPISVKGAAGTGSRIQVVQTNADASGIGMAFIQMHEAFGG